MVVQLRMWHMSMVAAVRILPRSLTKPQPLLTGSDVIMMGSKDQETHCTDNLFWKVCTAVITPGASVYSLMVIDDCQLPAMRSWAFLDHTDHSQEPAGHQEVTWPPLLHWSNIDQCRPTLANLSVLMSKSD